MQGLIVKVVLGYVLHYECVQDCIMQLPCSTMTNRQWGATCTAEPDASYGDQSAEQHVPQMAMTEEYR